VRKAEAAGQTGSGSDGGSASGGGGGTAEIGTYHDHIHDRFFSVWDQPTSIANTANFVTGLRIRIESDGRISDFKVVRSSGNVVMDESVLAAARRVLKVDALPKGLGSGGAYEVTINFELE
jgi:TonB family protein